MAGMVVALSGMLLLTSLERRAGRMLAQARDSLREEEKVIQ
jgi:biopolymer transport protein ExbB